MCAGNSNRSPGGATPHRRRNDREARSTNHRKWISFLLTAILLLTLASAGTATTEPLGITLGSASLTDGVYYYSSATVEGDDTIRTLLISFSNNVTTGDKIILPSATTGFTVSSTGNDYTKRVNVSGADTSAVQAYLRKIGFQIASATQSIRITATADDIETDTYYREYNGHYYQYIAYPTATSGTWTDA
jgi:hypothetical protein